LEVIGKQSHFFEAEVLCANHNAELLVEQALKFKPNCVVIADESRYDFVKSALESSLTKVYSGTEALSQVVQMETVDIVLTAMVGYAGLKPTIAAIEAGKTIALANKETLVVAGELITRMAREKGVNIYPVDSEHSAIFQCLVGEWHNPIEKIYLTASGGPFKGKTRDDLEHVTREQALKHPNWTMGAKVTIDSATLMNKGLEVIEAKWLFGLKPEQVKVIIHPQSIIHGMVEYRDGSVVAQLGSPDMRIPIAHCLAWPTRIDGPAARLDLAKLGSLTFEAPDADRFPSLALGRQALETGGAAPTILNAANEVAVAAFIAGQIGFGGIADLVEATLEGAERRNATAEPQDIEEALAVDHMARSLAHELLPEIAAKSF